MLHSVLTIRSMFASVKMTLLAAAGWEEEEEEGEEGEEGEERWSAIPSALLVTSTAAPTPRLTNKPTQQQVVGERE